ncbi:asparagine synthase (glutamine-hydrolyzing) [Amycolatopsis sp. A1MSW2902]|uniref:asparagine synthase (glutamine-hydrolyzing) n=1 Tax=Amycolatopsis sp. A1MSW2902 TaxID=687413 RepID=UPI00307DF87E
MCGITGWVAFEEDVTRRRDIVEEMTATMALRGPDEGGTWFDTHVGLGHRRLAVIDPPGGKQPMTAATPAGEVVLVYSGEVYNFVALREELVRRGHRFATRSDTEVVLRAYLQWGEALAERLDGMFAFAVWDGRDNRLVLVRDRLGIKPLFWHRTRDGAVFGSEAKAVLAHPAVPRVVDTAGLRELVAFTKTSGWVLWRDVTEVEPGTVLTITADGVRERTYWRLSSAEHRDSPAETVERVRALLGDIAARQVVADVPQCVLLSGGLDSSALTGLAHAALADDGEKVRSFSVDFGHEEDFAADELRGTPDAPFVRDVAAHVGSQHHNVLVDTSRLLDPEVRRAVVAARDFPAGLGDIDTSLYLLFSRIRQEATVALSGEAADEVFGGYAWFHHPALRDSGTFPWLAAQNTYTTDRTGLLRPELREAMDVAGFIADEYVTAVAGVEHRDGEDAAERSLRTASHLHLTRLVRAMLDRKDRLSMAVGLEVRVPFADHHLVEYVHNAPWSVKTADGHEKSLLRAAVAPLLPTSVLERRKSHYPSTQDTGYVRTLQRQAAEVVAEREHAVFSVIDRQWAAAATSAPVEQLAVPARNGMERLLDLYHWIDLYRPELRVA